MSPRAFGRSLADFGTLSAAEKQLLDACRIGEVAHVGETCPSVETAVNTVRAAFFRFLALGGDETASVHEHGIRLQGAWLTGVLEFQNLAAAHPIWLMACRLGELKAFDARFVTLLLSGSRLDGKFEGDRLRCLGGLFLRNGFEAMQEVHLRGARIEGDLDCTDSRFLAGTQHTLDCDSARISGYLFLRKGFRAVGRVNLLGITVGRDLECGGGIFEGGDGVALECSSSIVTGGVYFRNGFRAIGGVQLIVATIGGDLECSSAAFDNPNGRALECSRARVEGAFIFRNIENVAGRISLSAMRAGQLYDDAKSWPGAGSLLLDGFSYQRFMGGAPTSAATRIAWLGKQIAEHLQGEFRPQPWEQVIAVLRASGHPEEARGVAVAKQDQLRRAGKILSGARVLHWLYGLLVGYGYRPMRLLAATASIWLFCAAAYWAASNPVWFDNENYLLAPSPSSSDTRAIDPDYRNFVPLIYSADVLLPVVDLGYKDEWQPVVADSAGNPLIWGRLLRFLYWFEIAFGWVAGLLLVGVLGNLIKKD